jgi:transcriptional regulator with XRE-family HTH domain
MTDTETSGEFEEWSDVAATDLADPSFAELVKADEVDQDEWDREYHATLAQLRRQLGHTQTEVAATMGTHQPQVSEIERRDDILVSTARSFVAALQANLELVARLPDGRKIIIDLGDLANEVPSLGALVPPNPATVAELSWYIGRYDSQEEKFLAPAAA